MRKYERYCLGTLLANWAANHQDQMKEFGELLDVYFGGAWEILTLGICGSGHSRGGERRNNDCSI